VCGGKGRCSKVFRLIGERRLGCPRPLKELILEARLKRLAASRETGEKNRCYLGTSEKNGKRNAPRSMTIRDGSSGVRDESRN